VQLSPSLPFHPSPFLYLSSFPKVRVRGVTPEFYFISAVSLVTFGIELAGFRIIYLVGLEHELYANTVMIQQSRYAICEQAT